ncbi:MAG: hypothetical protein OEW12_07055 [Deltaproteobacteria bacterium]|nr:hypothetical protein [Deltaproteobacteria bacterium]
MMVLLDFVHFGGFFGLASGSIPAAQVLPGMKWRATPNGQPDFTEMGEKFLLTPFAENMKINFIPRGVFFSFREPAARRTAGLVWVG